MKILFLTHFFYPNIGGIEVNSELLALAFYNAGEEIRLLTWTEETGDKHFPFPVIRKPSITEIFRQHQWADIIFENNPCLRLSWPAVLLRKKTITALCTWISRTNGATSWQDKLKFLWLSRASSVIAVSDEVRKLSWPSAIVIGNPYRSAIFKTLTNISRQPEFVFLGRLVSDKGVDIAINAFGKLVRSHPEFQDAFFTIIGEGPEFETLKKNVRNLGLDKNIGFTGSLRGDALVSCLNRHRFIVVPSRWKEPFGNVALEGMACGCVPIVADGGGLQEAIGNAGLIFKRGDDDDLLRCMEQLLNNAGLEAALREAGKIQLQQFEPDVVAGSYLRVIRTAAGN